MAKQAKGEMICLQVIRDDGEDATAEKKRIHAEHLEQHPEDKGKAVDWIELVIKHELPRDESRPTWDDQPDPEPAPACVPSIPFWTQTALCSEQLPGGQIAEGLYGVADGQVHVTTPQGKFVGKAPKGGDALTTARQILRGASKSAGKWLRAALPSKSIV